MQLRQPPKLSCCAPQAPVAATLTLPLGAREGAGQPPTLRAALPKSLPTVRLSCAAGLAAPVETQLGQQQQQHQQQQQQHQQKHQQSQHQQCRPQPQPQQQQQLTCGGTSAALRAAGSDPILQLHPSRLYERPAPQLCPAMPAPSCSAAAQQLPRAPGQLPVFKTRDGSALLALHKCSRTQSLTLWPVDGSAATLLPSVPAAAQTIHKGNQVRSGVRVG